MTTTSLPTGIPSGMLAVIPGGVSSSLPARRGQTSYVFAADDGGLVVSRVGASGRIGPIRCAHHTPAARRVSADHSPRPRTLRSSAAAATQRVGAGLRRALAHRPTSTVNTGSLHAA